VRRPQFVFSAILAASVLAGPAHAADLVSFITPGADEALRTTLQNASLAREAGAAKSPNAQDLFASARADYARLLGVLYDQGYYSGTISIRIDGHEAAAIAPMDAPARIGQIELTIEPGPRFVFAQAAIAPVAPGTQLPKDYRIGATARSGLIVEAATAGVSGWREAGHAKAAVAGQKIIADHRANTLAADVTLAPGPVVHFGDLHTSGNKRLRSKRLVEIAGFPTGEKYAPEKMDKVRTRLRRTGIFSSVTLTEADKLGPDNSLDVELAVVEEKLRRMGFGAEIASSDGLTLNGYWLHRNLFGGGEKLRIDAEVAGVGGATGGTDYTLGARLDRPATFTPDTSAFVVSKIAKTYEEDYDERTFTLGFGLSHIFNDRLTGESAVEYQWSEVNDDSGRTIFRQVAFPNTFTWDNRDVAANATKGYYGMVTLTPFVGLGDTGSGAQLKGDFRAYRGFGTDNRFVLAGRAQIGGVFGPSLATTPRDYLFYSGGGGTVRGQPYESLGVDELDGGTLRTGGTRFLGVSGELRAGITDTIGLVAFYDAGFISADDYFSGGEWQSGAGLGLRYNTPIGPIRLDIAAPVSGSTGDGAQIYLGIGQAF